MESSNSNLSSPNAPDDLTQLREQVAFLTRRVAALERAAGVFENRAISVKVQPSQERRFGLTAVNRIGAFTLALGILFFFKYAADNGWIGPVGRLLAGVIAGVAFLFFGEWLRSKGQAALALGINGCGLAILYITAYAAGELYRIITPGASLILLVTVAALGIGVAIRSSSQSLAAVTMGAAFILPLLVNKTIYGMPALIYLALASAAGLIVAVKEEWLMMTVSNLAALTIVGTLTDNKADATAVLFFSQAALYWAARLRTLKPDGLANSLYVCGHAAAVIGGLWLISAWVSAVSVALTLASVLLALYGIAVLAFGIIQRSNVNRLTGLSMLGLVICKLYFYDVWQLSYGFRITAFVVLGALLLSASFLYSRWKARN